MQKCENYILKLYKANISDIENFCKNKDFLKFNDIDQYIIDID